MKKSLLLLAAALGVASFGAKAADPVFPTQFKLSADTKLVNITQTYDDDYEAIVIQIDGVTPNAKLNVTFDLPEGWDGVLALDNSINPLNRTKKTANWVPLDLMTSEINPDNLQTGKTLTFDADGKAYMFGCFLYAGNQVDTENGFMILCNVAQDETAVEPSDPDPVFPEDEVDLTASDGKVTVDQIPDEDNRGFLVILGGTSTDESFTVDVNLPEGFEGVIGGKNNEMAGDVDDGPELPTGWISIDDFKATFGQGLDDLQQGKKLTFPADGKGSHYTFWPFANGKVNTDKALMFVVNVKKAVGVGIGDVEVENAAPRYFNLQGVEVEKPVSGIYIKVCGGKVTKEIVR